MKWRTSTFALSVLYPYILFISLLPLNDMFRPVTPAVDRGRADPMRSSNGCAILCSVLAAPTCPPPPGTFSIFARVMFKVVREWTVNSGSYRLRYEESLNKCSGMVHTGTQFQTNMLFYIQTLCAFKGTVPRYFWLQLLFTNQFSRSPWVSH